MSDFIRAYGMKMAHNGVCRKCQKPRDKGNHDACDRWPGGFGMKTPKGIHYVGNSQETTLAELKKFVAAVCAGDDDSTPIQFEIRVREIFPPRDKQPKVKAGAGAVAVIPE
jgi:hypothetical protein